MMLHSLLISVTYSHTDLIPAKPNRDYEHNSQGQTLLSLHHSRHKSACMMLLKLIKLIPAKRLRGITRLENRRYHYKVKKFFFVDVVISSKV